MIDFPLPLGCALTGLFRSRARLEAEILVLRQQINVLRRQIAEETGIQQHRSLVARLAISAGPDDA